MWMHITSQTACTTHDDARRLVPSLPPHPTDHDMQQAGFAAVARTPWPVYDPLRERVVSAAPEQVWLHGQAYWKERWQVLALAGPDAEMASAMALRMAKNRRKEQVAAIVVATAAGRMFDGDEDSQRRMTSAVTAMDDGDTLPWVLHDNSVAVVGKAELREALRLAGAEMAAIWTAVYGVGAT